MHSRTTFLLVVAILVCSCYHITAFIVKGAGPRQYHVFSKTHQATMMSADLPVFPVEGIAQRYRVVKFGQGSTSYNGLQVADRNYASKVISIEMSRVGGLGLDLLEFPSDDDKGDMGLVLVGDVIPGSNAEKSGLYLPGDALVSINAVRPGEAPFTLKLEGLNFESTVAALSRYSEYDTVSITVRRMIKRGEVVIQMVGPQGEDAGNFTMLAGFSSNLRLALQAKNMKLYDTRTSRFDSPYETGNCGGDGTCGTCIVAVLSGKELLNERARVEDKALKNQLAPPNYRWSCRAQVARDPETTGTVKIKLRPQSTTW